MLEILLAEFVHDLLLIPKSNLKFYEDRSFQVAAPSLWNGLPDNKHHHFTSLHEFKKETKTLCFREAFY